MRNSLALLALNIALLLVPRLAAAQLAPMATDRQATATLQLSLLTVCC